MMTFQNLLDVSAYELCGREILQVRHLTKCSLCFCRARSSKGADFVYPPPKHCKLEHTGDLMLRTHLSQRAWLWAEGNNRPSTCKVEHSGDVALRTQLSQ